MFQALKSWLFERDVKGNYWYTNSHRNWTSEKVDNLDIAQEHPFLTPGLLFIANLFAQGRFKVIRRSTGLEVSNHWILRLLNDPNYYQTRIDLLESTQFVKMARGSAVLYGRRGVGREEVDSIYVLDPHLIKYPKDFIAPTAFKRREEAILNQVVVYDPHGENLKIRLRDLVYLYDQPSGFSNTKPLLGKGDGSTEIRNRFTTKSRVDGIKQTLINTLDSHIAKNIILKTNGKEIVSGESNGMPLNPAEKEEAERVFNSKYGLSWGRRRTLVVKGALRWQSAHIAVRDLGLDESTKIDATVVFNALGIPKDIYSIESKKTTYNNFKESMSSFIQNSIYSIMLDFTESLNKYWIEDNYELVGTYDHLPIMNFLELEKLQALNAKADAILKLRQAGVPDELIVELAELPAGTVLEEAPAPEGSGDTSDEDEEKEYYKRLGIYQ